MPPKPKFQDGEKVLCYHGPLLYEAKIMKNRKEPAPNKSGGGAAAAASSAADNSGGSFLVHYQGWNKNWDEWVPEGRVLKINAENLSLKNRLHAEQQAAAPSKDKKKASKSKDGSKEKGQAAGGASGTGSGGGGSSGTPGTSTPTGGGGREGSRKQSESASTSRASTPVSERSAKSGGARGRGREVADDERSNSSRDGDDDAEEEKTAPPQRKKPRRSSAGSASGATTPGGGGGASSVSSRRQRQELAEAEEEDEFRVVKFQVSLKKFTVRHKNNNTKAATHISRREYMHLLVYFFEFKLFQIHLPEELRVVLRNDHELVTEKRSLFTIPAKAPVSAVIADFLREVEARERPGKLVFYEQCVESIKTYFDAKLGKDLLYRYEL